MARIKKTGIRKNTLKLNEEIRERFIDDGALLQKIAEKTGKGFMSVRRWFAYSTEQLQRIDVVNTITEVTGLSYEEMFNKKVDNKQTINND
jgi:hypothetical protein